MLENEESGVFGHFIICGRKLRKLKMDDFWQKLQADSLTFWPKDGVFGHFIICGRKCKKVENGRFLAKIARQYPYFLAKIWCCWALYNWC